MTYELKPSPEAVRIAEEVLCAHAIGYHTVKTDGSLGGEFLAQCEKADAAALNAAALVIDRALRSHSTDGLRIPPVDAVCDDVDRALRPATVRGDVVEETAREVMSEYLGLPIEECDAGSRGGLLVQEGYKRALTAMQPAIQAAVDALDAVEAAQINPTYGWNITALNKARPLVASALATLRTVTEQGEG